MGETPVPFVAGVGWGLVQRGSGDPLSMRGTVRALLGPAGQTGVSWPMYRKRQREGSGRSYQRVVAGIIVNPSCKFVGGGEITVKHQQNICCRSRSRDRRRRRSRSTSRERRKSSRSRSRDRHRRHRSRSRSHSRGHRRASRDRSSKYK